MVQKNRLIMNAMEDLDSISSVMPKRRRPHLLLLCGPTAVGKTGCAVSLAQYWNTDILSADSIQIYRRLNIGSAKPTAEELALAPHHLIDIVEPDASYSVAQYKSDFESCLAMNFQKKIPVVCGGTGLYFNAILYEYDFAGAFDAGEVRAKWKDYAEREGKDALFEELQKIDPETATVLSPNDQKRVIRALEIFELTGKRKSELSPRLTDKYDFTVIGLRKERELLYKLINNRVLCMFRNGLVEEVESLLKGGIDERCQSMQAIGYKETAAYLRGGKTLEETIGEIQQASRNYAKRQITWFKRLPGIRWLEAGDSDVAAQIREIYERDEEENKQRLTK